jgi:hypothetical protein
MKTLATLCLAAGTLCALTVRTAPHPHGAALLTGMFYALAALLIGGAVCEAMWYVPRDQQ